LQEPLLADGGAVIERWRQRQAQAGERERQPQFGDRCRRLNATKVEKPIARALAWASEDRFPASLSATSKPIAGSLPRRISILTRSLVGETVEYMDSSYSTPP
jgi:hypothetical protein